MKTLVITIVVLIGSALVSGAIATLGARQRMSQSKKKVPMFLFGLLLAVAAVLLVGLGVRSLPRRDPVSMIFVGGAWCFGAAVGLQISKRLLFASLARKYAVREEKA